MTSPEAPAPQWIAVGRVTRPHGVKGEVAVLPLSQVESRFEPGSRLFVGDSGDRCLTVSSSRPHRHRLLVSFEGLGDRTGAEELSGQYLFVPVGSAPPLPKGEYWAHELVGCEVVTEAGRPLGRVHEIIHTAANDVWVTSGSEGEILIPALKDVVTRVETEDRRIVVREIEGLTVP